MPLRWQPETRGRAFLKSHRNNLAMPVHAPEGDVSLDSYPNVRRLLASIEALDGFVPMQSSDVGLNAANAS